MSENHHPTPTEATVCLAPALAAAGVINAENPALPFPSMTAKEQLLDRVRGLSESEAEAALALMEGGLRDPLAQRLDSSPPEDEEISTEEEAAAAEGRADIAAGRTVMLDEVMREHE